MNATPDNGPEGRARRPPRTPRASTPMHLNGKPPAPSVSHLAQGRRPRECRHEGSRRRLPLAHLLRRMFLLPAMNQNRRPFRQALTQQSARGLRLVVARLARRHRSIMQRGQLGGVIRHPKHEESEVDQHRQDRLAGELHPASPPSRGAKRTRNLAINFHPMIQHGIVPETLHLPGDKAHVGRRPYRQAVAPDHIFRRCLLDRAKANFRFSDRAGAFGDEFGHLGRIAGLGIVKDEDAVHGAAIKSPGA